MENKRRFTAAGVVTALVGAVLAVTGAAAPPASAALSGVVQRPSSVVTSDALPTVQIDGVAWDQEVVGNTVYVAGSFTTARPAGAAPGVNTVPRANLLAYDLTTGNLITSFNHTLNAQALTVSASPDGSRIYVGGDFTQVDGVTRNRIAAFDTATGNLVAGFSPNVASEVRAIAATESTVYIGGSFTTVAGNPRANLAAVQASNGALTTWNPGTDLKAFALLVTPDRSKVIVGGSFETIAGHAAHGLAALDPVTGAWVDWAATNLIQNGGANAAINSLTTDGTNIYGSGFRFGGGVGGSLGRLEGAFSATQAGAVRWVEDCHGDSYDSYAGTGMLYVVSHAHYCGNMGGHQQTSPFSFQHAMAFSSDATGTLGKEPWGYFNFAGTPSPSIFNWFPTFSKGTATGQNQAAWTVEGNDTYVAMGGEFPSVNGKPQQGLVRFAVRGVSPGADGPATAGNNFLPTITGVGAGALRIGWNANYDRDDRTLTYTILRNDPQNGISQPNIQVGPDLTADSTWFDQPPLGYVDTGLTPGVTYTYRVIATDPWGNQAVGGNVSAVAPATGGQSGYGNRVVADGASFYFPFRETSGSVAANNAYANGGFGDADALSGVTFGSPGLGAGDTAPRFDGTTNSTLTVRQFLNTGNLSVSAWVKTTSTTGGKIIALSDEKGGALTGTGTGFYLFSDRQLYLDNQGRANFAIGGVTPGTLTGTKVLNDGAWHQVVGTLGSGGMSLYVDGNLAGTKATTTVADVRGGYWRVGGDTTDFITTNKPTSANLNGFIDEVAVFPSALTGAKVSAQYSAGVAAQTNAAPTASFTTSTTDLSASFDASGSTDSDGTIASYAWTFGDGTSATGSTATHPYSSAGTVTVAPAVGIVDRDAFSRTTSPGWGTADVGGAWSVSSPNAFSVGGGVGSMKAAAAGNQVMATMGGVSAADASSIVDVALDKTPTGGGSYPSVILRRNSTANNDYRAKVTITASTVRILLTKVLGGTETALSANALVPSLNYNVGDTLRIAFQATGSSPTTLRAKVWKLGSAEPASWQVTTTDSSAALQPSPGLAMGAGLVFYLSSSTTNAPTQLLVDNFAVARGGATPQANVPPSAVSSLTKTDLTVDADGSASSDSDGAIRTYGWDFGDGTTAVGPTATHTYSTPGTYSVALTVTDNEGASTTTTKSVTVKAPNVLPTAHFTGLAHDDLTLDLDGTSSADIDGTIVDYAWDFGDGSSGSGATLTHQYSTSGLYPVTLTVTDSDGATDSFSETFPVGNQPPSARFVATPNKLVLGVDASTSLDSDGTVVSYAWDFGDGATDTGVTASHTYADAGTYTVSLLVTDDDGATDTTTQSVTVQTNQPPHAAFTSTATKLKLDVDATTSTDADGTVASYAWDFGDGATGTGVTATHTYDTAGTYTVSLLVTDSDGATDTTTSSVTVVANQAPTAAFTSTSTALKLNVDASTSSDADGTVASYAWDFGDGATDTGKTATHTYAAGGTYDVTLTVTDNDGATNATTASVTVIPLTVVAADTFGRTVTNGWGTADTGGAWTGSSAPPFSVGSGVGSMRIAAAGSTVTGFLNSSSGRDVSATADYSLDKASTGGGVYTSLVLRRLPTGNTDYRAVAQVLNTGAVKLSMNRTVNGTTTALGTAVTVPGLTYAVGDTLRIAFETIGTSPTTLRAKIWKVGSAEPATWQVTASDSTAALQVAGGVGLVGYVSSTATNAPVTLRFDNLSATSNGAPPANTPPTAAITTTTSGLTVNASGTGSTDPDGTIASYAWTFGDGGTGTGATSSHTYTAAGTYTVGLTVTDDKGATNSTTTSVTVSSAGANLLATDAFGRTTANGWGTADQGGAWTITGTASAFSTNGSQGVLATAKGVSLSTFLNSVSGRDVSSTVDFSLDKPATGGGAYTSVVLRRIGTSDYRALLIVAADGSVKLSLNRVVSGTQTTIGSVLTVPGLTYTVGDTLRVTFEVSGSGTSTLRAKVWKVGTTEPAAFQVTTTDTTAALQAAGGAGLVSYLSSSATNGPISTRYDNYSVTRTGPV